MRALRGGCLVALLTLAAGAADGQAVHAVDREQVNVRADATTQSARVGVLPRGVQVVELRRVGQWLQVRMPDGNPWWIHAQLLRPQLLVEGEGLRLRDGPSATSTSVTMLFRGQEVGELATRGGWTQVQLKDGRAGWLSSQYVRPKTEADLASERPAATAVEPPPAPATPAAAGPADEATPAPEIATILRDPYAEGLQHEAGGDHALALDAFVEVLDTDPDHVNALVHAAQAHRKLGETEMALDKLYRALRLTGGRKDVYLTLGEIYRQQGLPDSSARYQALFRGEAPPAAGSEEDVRVDTVADAVERSPLPKGTVLDDLPKPATAADDGGPTFDSVWLPIGLAGIGLLALAAVGWWVVTTSSHRTEKGAAIAADPRFGKAMDEETRQARHGKATTEEEAELDRQIDGRWRELKESAAAFAPAPATGDGVDGILDQVEGLRRTLEGQDERARIYADIVRLQNMKIEAMTEEIRRLRRG